jgi:hypothetical protein
LKIPKGQSESVNKNACLGNVPILHSSDTRNKETGIYRYIISFNSAIYQKLQRNNNKNSKQKQKIKQNKSFSDL